MTLRTLRQRKGYTQRELAGLCGMPLRTVQQYEYGKRDINGARLKTLCTLALALDCKVYDLLTDEETKIKLKRTV